MGIAKKYELGRIEIIFILIILLAAAAAGVYAWKAGRDKQASINSFAECVEAGNPVMESYPEQCAANGQVWTNPDQLAGEPSDTGTQAKEEDQWLVFTPQTGSYSLRIPDGWQAVELSGNLYVREADKLVYGYGARATVEVMEDGGWDGPTPFSLYYPEQNQDEIVKEGKKEGMIITDGGLVVEKYKYVQTTEQEEIGYQKGDTSYNYYFGADGKYIVVSHVFSAGGVDQSAMVERLIRTIKIN